MDLVDFVRQHIHLTREHLVDYINGNLESPLLEAVERHLKVCRFCNNDVEIWSRLIHLPEMKGEIDYEETDEELEAYIREIFFDELSS